MYSGFIRRGELPKEEDVGGRLFQRRGREGGQEHIDVQLRPLRLPEGDVIAHSDNR